MEALEKKMLETVSFNLSHCTDFPDGFDEFDQMTEDELINWVKIIRGSIKDNINMIRTIIENDTPKGGGGLMA